MHCSFAILYKRNVDKLSSRSFITYVLTKGVCFFSTLLSYLHTDNSQLSRYVTRRKQTIRRLRNRNMKRSYVFERKHLFEKVGRHQQVLQYVRS